MKRYKLLKDLPTFKAGQLAYISEQGSLIAGNPDKPEITDAGVQLMMYHKTTLKKFPNILTEWFEEIPNPTDSIHWEPLPGDIYWYLSNTGVVLKKKWMSSPDDIMRYVIGNTYRTEKECDKAYDRKLAEARLRQTSTFKPDFENDEGGWVVCYYHRNKELDCTRIYSCDYGEPVRYATEEEAEKSIRENERDWKIYFGIKEEE